LKKVEEGYLTGPTSRARAAAPRTARRIAVTPDSSPGPGSRPRDTSPVSAAHAHVSAGGGLRNDGGEKGEEEGTSWMGSEPPPPPPPPPRPRAKGHACGGDGNSWNALALSALRITAASARAGQQGRDTPTLGRVILPQAVAPALGDVVAFVAVGVFVVV